MEKMGLCQKGSSPWASPLHIVTKKDSTLLPCGDYRGLNMITEADHYPLLNITDETTVLHGTKISSKLDILKGYFQVPMNPEDILKTAITTPFRTFTFNYSFFGLHNGEHLQHLYIVLQRLQENGLIVHYDKCSFTTKRVEFLGHLITPEGVLPLPEKVAAVRKFSTSTTIKALQEFLGMVNILKGKPKALNWGYPQEAVFTSTKNALAKATALSFPAPGHSLLLSTDTSSQLADKQQQYPELNACKTSLMSLQWHDIPLNDNSPTSILCDISTSRPRPLIPQALGHRPWSDTFRTIHSHPPEEMLHLRHYVHIAALDIPKPPPRHPVASQLPTILNPVAWLPWVLLSLQTTSKEGLDLSAAEMVYSNPLVIPGEFFPNINTPSGIIRLQTIIGKFAPDHPFYKPNDKTFIPKDLHTAMHVFIRTDAIRPPLTQPYTGPYWAVDHKQKAFLIDIHGRTDWVAINHLKPAYLPGNITPPVQF
ncbi:uncharacterized protein [Macrobrachium rosenbergii]|uniref:uncharacterized protein n=1 Tax=Macrobrachium rosenbergii TaxID=79674 RepID=UPI0034D708EE